ncbi:MAG: nucleoside recognition domain-containing protein [Anaerovoracaceae bacterium]|jgi:hypothetical protein|nr:nucleoside recognition domain-containing protein [Anaerovoracaceae bacterium]
MSESFDFIVREMVTGSLTTMLNLLKVLVPLMIVIQILMTYGIIEKLASKMEGFGRLMGMSKNAMFPLLVGFVMGVSYGAGTLLELNKTNPLSKRDMVLVGIFMFLCHGVIETGLLFGVAGASVLVITLGRALIALTVTIILARTPFIKKMDNALPLKVTPQAKEALEDLATKE